MMRSNIHDSGNSSPSSHYDGDISDLRIPPETSLERVNSEIDEANQKYLESLYGDESEQMEVI